MKEMWEAVVKRFTEKVTAVSLVDLLVHSPDMTKNGLAVPVNSMSFF